MREGGRARARTRDGRRRGRGRDRSRWACGERRASFLPPSPPAARAAVARVAAARAVYAVYAISSLDTGSSLRHGTQTAWGFVGTHQGVAGLTPRPFTLEEETGSHYCICCLCCSCSKLARQWFIPKTRHTNCVGGRRDTPRGLGHPWAAAGLRALPSAAAAAPTRRRAPQGSDSPLGRRPPERPGKVPSALWVQKLDMILS